MDAQISTIKKVDVKKEDIHSVVMLDRGLNGTDMKFLEDEFDFKGADVNRAIKNYKNLALALKFNAIHDEMMKDWKLFLQKAITDEGAFKNVYLSKKYDKALLITNKRLLRVDLERLNTKIEETNYRIESYNQKAAQEMAKEEPQTTESAGFFSKFKVVWEK